MKPVFLYLDPSPQERLPVNVVHLSQLAWGGRLMEVPARETPPLVQKHFFFFFFTPLFFLYFLLWVETCPQ